MVKSRQSRIVFTSSFLTLVFVSLYYSFLWSHQMEPANGGGHSLGVSDVGALVRMTEEITRAGRVPLIATVNAAYLPMTLSWLCNTAAMAGVHEQTVVIATDDATHDALRRRWPTVRVFRHVTQADMTQRHKFGSNGYRVYLLMRVKLMFELLRHNVSFIMFETDCLWRKNPVPLLGDVTSSTGYDVVAAQLGNKPHLGNYSVNFMFLNATPGGVGVWGEMVRRLEKGLLTEYEQDILDGLCKARHAGARCRLFPYEQIADGMWYRMTAEARRRLLPDPYIINNNFIVGVAKKMTRAKAYGHWFLAKDGETCRPAKPG
ncbi:PREDICTED: UDP-D-xylose:L-fucose alpha-1,3-D-xylosyltransferase 3-like [Priapulus caudatus]|uniref:UDP-D-xylose:L-fucose alpha-1,3-D-xylosyltransferase 3-like n=1 Tax=Priapulus caudatus TaxID=37621 RepID=A0ABM1F2C0_PRICU|nr:PREDICTED: UDP-D-xylose:L-fucose alpha-1,3-D-xylosyltransferase 3-like [Priapulus caudatus]